MGVSDRTNHQAGFGSLHIQLLGVETTKAGPRVIKLFSMLNSTEYDFFLLVNVKMPTTFMSRKNSMAYLSLKQLHFVIIL